MYYREFHAFRSVNNCFYRIPSIVVEKDGTIIAFANKRVNSLMDYVEKSTIDVAVRRPGEEWSEPVSLVDFDGIAAVIGNAVYDSETGETMCAFYNTIAFPEFGDMTEEDKAEMKRKAEEAIKNSGVELGNFWVCTKDGGKTFDIRPLVIDRKEFVTCTGEKVTAGFSGHGSAPGVQLRHGKHKGRLLVPTRFISRRNRTIEELRETGYNNTIYSDDHGKTWTTGGPVQVGTGEGTLMECCDGTIYFNSREYFSDAQRRIAVSTDDGETFGQFRIDDYLIEDGLIGCNGSLLHIDREDLKDEDKAMIPEEANSVTIFANPRSKNKWRNNMTLCVSYDEGKSWAMKHTVWGGGSAYSAMAYDKTTGRVNLLFEKGDKHACDKGLTHVEFDFEWLIQD